jgi:fused signal recognition particle receptor
MGWPRPAHFRPDRHDPGATEIKPETWDDLEALLIQADLGVGNDRERAGSARKAVDQEGSPNRTSFRAGLRSELRHCWQIPAIEWTVKPAVILIVGVNGSGKTTTIAKLGRRFADQGKNVLLGAADTFRAAAVDQLEIWAERLNLPVISGQLGGDAGAVAYDTVQAALARQSDIVLIERLEGCTPLQPDGKS